MPSLPPLLEAIAVLIPTTVQRTSNGQHEMSNFHSVAVAPASRRLTSVRDLHDGNIALDIAINFSRMHRGSIRKNHVNGRHFCATDNVIIGDNEQTFYRLTSHHDAGTSLLDFSLILDPHGLNMHRGRHNIRSDSGDMIATVHQRHGCRRNRRITYALSSHRIGRRGQPK